MLFSYSQFSNNRTLKPIVIELYVISCPSAWALKICIRSSLSYRLSCLDRRRRPPFNPRSSQAKPPHPRGVQLLLLDLRVRLLPPASRKLQQVHRRKRDLPKQRSPGPFAPGRSLRSSSLIPATLRQRPRARVRGQRPTTRRHQATEAGFVEDRAFPASASAVACLLGTREPPRRRWIHPRARAARRERPEQVGRRPPERFLSVRRDRLRYETG